MTSRLDTVVVTAGGSATLVEVGVLAAVRGLPSEVGRDVVAWAALARNLAAAATTNEAELLLAAAATAESGDLAFAVRRLAHEAEQLPDFVDRESLVDALPTIKSAAPRIPRQTSTIDPPNIPVRARFGRGVPLAATAASLPADAKARRRTPWKRAAWVAALIAVLSLGAAALWWPLLP